MGKSTLGTFPRKTVFQMEAVANGQNCLGGGGGSLNVDRCCWNHTVSPRGQAFTHSQLNKCQHFYVTLLILETVSCQGGAGTDGLQSGENGSELALAFQSSTKA